MSFPIPKGGLPIFVDSPPSWPVHDLEILIPKKALQRALEAGDDDLISSEMEKLLRPNPTEELLDRITEEMRKISIEHIGKFDTLATRRALEYQTDEYLRTTLKPLGISVRQRTTETINPGEISLNYNLIIDDPLYEREEPDGRVLRDEGSCQGGSEEEGT